MRVTVLLLINLRFFFQYNFSLIACAAVMQHTFYVFKAVRALM